MRSNVAVDVKHIVDAFAYTVAIKNLSIHLNMHSWLYMWVSLFVKLQSSAPARRRHKKQNACSHLFLS